MGISSQFRFIFVALAILVAASAAHGSFHVMQIEQVIGGVDGDTTAQAIQLRMRASGQNIVSGASLWVSDATGANRVLILNIAANVSNGAAGARVLITSANFGKYTSPALASDFTMANLIPASYLAAGRLTYEQDGGTVSTPGTILWSLSWGGSNYTGPQTGDTINDANGNFGPAYGSPLPSAGTQALLFQGTASAASTSNFADYSLTGGSAVFTKNSGTSYTVLNFKPTITAFTRETNNLRITWTTIVGKANALQRTTNGSLSTNFIDIFTNLATGSVTNYLDIGAVTNFPTRFYRVRHVP